MSVSFKDNNVSQEKYKISDLINDKLPSVTIRLDYQDTTKPESGLNTSQIVPLKSGTYQINSNSDLYSANFNSPAFTITNEIGSDVKDYVLVAKYSNKNINEIKFEAGSATIKDGATARDSIIFFTDGSSVTFTNFPFIAVKIDDAGLHQAA